MFAVYNRFLFCEKVVQLALSSAFPGYSICLSFIVYTFKRNVNF